jgi:hypothetical protein
MGKGMKAWTVLLGVALLAAWAWPAAGDAVSDKRKAQNKLLAYRAARADGIRKLAERIRGLRITSQTTVRDFVTESDTINTAMRAFLAGVREAGKPKYMEDGTCEVVVEVTLQELIVQLKQFHKSYYKGDKVKVVDFDKMTVLNKTKVLRETGMGAPRPEFVEEPLVAATAANLASLTHLTGPAKAYWLARVMPQGRLMAVRGARVDAMRRLGERIAGVQITSATTVRDFVAESDQIDVDMRTFLRGARETGIRYHADELIVEVEMAVTLRDVLVSIKTWAARHYKGDKVKVRQFDELIIKARDKVIKETGMSVPAERFLKQLNMAEKRVVALGARAPGWVTQTLRATGQAALDAENPNKAQARLMALRGAELDARRKLAERINGLTITSSTTVNDFVTANDQVQTSMLAFQQGARILEASRKVLADGTAQAIVEIDLKPLWNMILYYQRTLSVTIK